MKKLIAATVLILWTAGTPAEEYRSITKPVPDNQGIRRTPGSSIGVDTRESWQSPVIYYLVEDDAPIGVNALNRDELYLCHVLTQRGSTYYRFMLQEGNSKQYGDAKRYSWQPFAPPDNVRPEWKRVWWSLLRKQRLYHIAQEAESRQRYDDRAGIGAEIFTDGGKMALPEREINRRALADKCAREDELWLKDKPPRLRGPLPSEVKRIHPAEPAVPF